MKIVAIKRFISVLLCIFLWMPVFNGAAATETSPGFAQVKVNSDVVRPADQINPAIDGDRVVWQDNRNGTWNIYMKDLMSSEESQISASATSQQYPAISGDNVVWSQFKEGAIPWISNIYMKNLSTGQVLKLSESASSQQYPAISGNSVVWQDNRTYYNDDIYLYDISTKTEAKITGLDQQRYPAISGDGIVWADWRNSSIDIYMHDKSTSEERRISFDVTDQNYPVISAEKIVWQDSRNGSSIYVYDIATSTETRISTHPGRYHQYNPSISGNIVVWQDYRNGNWDIYMYNISEGIEYQVTTDSGDQINPAVSDNRIVWQDNRNANWDIFMYDISSKTETQINSDISFILADQVNPAVDGNFIVWEDNRDGYPHVYMKNLASGIERRLSSSGATQQYPAISGDKVVWQDSRNGGSIYMYDISASSEKRIAGITSQYSPPVSPKIDGDRIVWQDYRDSWYYSDVYMYNLSTLSEQRITGGTWQYVPAREPDISEDNVVWLQDDLYWDLGWYWSTVHMGNLLTGEESVLTRGYYIDNPAISGDTVVWQSGYYNEYYWDDYYYWYGNPDIYMHDSSSGVQTPLTTNEYAQINPAISGDKVAWADRRIPWSNTNYGVFLYDMSTGSDTRLTTSMHKQDNPDISGDKVVWQDYRNGNWDVYMIDLTAPPNSPPIAYAGSDQTVNEGDSVNLDGTGSSDFDGDPLAYSWTQTAGPAVTLTGGDTETPSFTAPMVDTDTTLTFELVVNDGTVDSDPDAVNVLVLDVSPPTEPGPAGPPADTTPPSVWFASPGEGWTLTDTIAVIAGASDNMGVSRVEFSIDGTYLASDDAVPYTWDWNTTMESDGPHTISAVAFDTARNSSTATILVTVANTAKVLGAVAGATGEIYGMVVNEAHQPIPLTCVRIDETCLPTNDRGEFRFTLVHPGIYTIHYDAEGYIGQTQVVEVKSGQVTTPPTVIMSPGIGITSTTGAIYGKVIDGAGQPIPLACIRINETCLPTNETGEFRFTLVFPSTYTIYYDAEGYVGQTQVVEVKAGTETKPPTVMMSK